MMSVIEMVVELQIEIEIEIEIVSLHYYWYERDYLNGERGRR